MGKDSDVHIRGRKYTRGEIEKEIARHVPLGREWCSSDDVLPDYITVCTPRIESIEPLGICRDFLLRDLPWYQCTQKIHKLGKCLVTSLPFLLYPFPLNISLMRWSCFSSSTTAFLALTSRASTSTETNKIQEYSEGISPRQVLVPLWRPP